MFTVITLLLVLFSRFSNANYNNHNYYDQKNYDCEKDGHVIKNNSGHYKSGHPDCKIYVCRNGYVHSWSYAYKPKCNYNEKLVPASYDCNWKCVKKYKDCKKGYDTYKHGKGYKTKCHSCVCDDGEWDCEPVECPKPHCPNGGYAIKQDKKTYGCCSWKCKTHPPTPPPTPTPTTKNPTPPPTPSPTTKNPTPPPTPSPTTKNPTPPPTPSPTPTDPPTRSPIPPVSTAPGIETTVPATTKPPVTKPPKCEYTYCPKPYCSYGKIAIKEVVMYGYNTNDCCKYKCYKKCRYGSSYSGCSYGEECKKYKCEYKKYGKSCIGYCASSSSLVAAKVSTTTLGVCGIVGVGLLFIGWKFGRKLTTQNTDIEELFNENDGIEREQLLQT